LPPPRRLLNYARLLNAAENANVEAVRELLDKDANPDVTDVYRYTPLMLAASKVTEPAERGTVIDLLLASGADVHAVEQAGQTALIHAVHANNLDAARRLLAAGAKVQWRAASGYDALYLAMGDSNLAVARALAAGELAGGGSTRRLLCQVLLGDASIISGELAAGEKADAADANGLTPLHAAALAGDPEVVDLLVAAGARVDVQDTEGLSPLIRAVHASREQVVVRLLEHGASTALRMATLYGDDPLSAAARSGQESIVRAVLAAGAAIDAAGRNGSALAAAASGGHEAIVALLLECGAPATRVGTLIAAISAGSIAIVRRILAAGADPNERVDLPEPHRMSLTPLVQAVFMRVPGIVSLLIDAGADVNARDAQDDTPLIWLAEVPNEPPDQIEIAKLLLDAGADVNARGDYNRTALSVAKQTKKTLLADVLLDAGADPTLAPD